MSLSNSSFAIFAMLVLVTSVQILRPRPAMLASLVLGANFIFAILQAYLSKKVADILVLLVLSTVPYAIFRFRSNLLSRFAIPLAISIVGIFIWFKTKNSGGAEGTSFDYIFSTSLPFGYSYVMFIALSLIAENRRTPYELSEQKPSLLKYLSVSTFFPAMAAGPFLRFHQIADSKFEPGTSNQFQHGLTLVFWGLAKKGIGDFLALNYLSGSGFNTTPNTLESWLLVFLIPARFYADFSGSADIAIGFGKTVGIELPENFRLPFLAKSVGDYWRRWHMSLGVWMQANVYLPLTLTLWPRTGKRLGPNLFNAMLITGTMIIVGAWHGLHPKFLFWGLAMGIFVSLSPRLKLSGNSMLASIGSIALTFYLMMWGQVFLIDTSFTHFVEKWIEMHTSIRTERAAFNPNALLPAVCISLIIPHAVDWRLVSYEKRSELERLVLLFASSIIYFLIGGAALPFIYSRF